IPAVEWTERLFNSIAALADQFLDRADYPPDRELRWRRATHITRLSRRFPGFDVIGLLRKTCENPSVLQALRNRADVCGPIVDEFDAAMAGGRIVNFIP